MRKLFYIAVEGPIGVGKTSLANLISRELGARLILEQFEENPFLSGFLSYDDGGEVVISSNVDKSLL